VIEGYFIHSGAAKNVKLNEVAPYHVSTQAGGASAFAVSINMNTWRKLPEEVKSAFLEVSSIFPDYLGKAARIDNDDGIQAYKDSKGTFVTINDDVRTKWAKSMPNIAQKWAEDQEKLGYPGKAVLKAYMDEMRLGKQPIMRNWDQE
jgi:TRAP-type C4-dicarboxylate transport system substrate-binding protein